MSLFFSAIPYILAAGATILGFLTLLKEWDEYKNARLRGGVVVVFTIVGMLGFVSLHLENREKKKAAEDISGLKGQVESAENAQKENTKVFVESFKSLSQKVTDLQTQVKTEALQKQVKRLQADLQANIKALGPGPKAELLFSFSHPQAPLGQPVIPIKEVTLPLKLDGSVHVEFNILNSTAVDAIDAEVNVQICDQCKYAKEPDGLSKLPGLEETRRYLFIHNLHAMTAYETLSLDVIPPPFVQAFPVGMDYRCNACSIPKEQPKGIVHILRP